MPQRSHRAVETATSEAWARIVESNRELNKLGKQIDNEQ